MGSGEFGLLTLPVTYLDEARVQIDGIGSFIAERGSPAIARDYVARLVDRCDKIGSLLFGGTPRDDLRPGLRSVPFERSATVFYRVTTDEVLIAAILYRGRDLTAHFT